MLFMVRFRPVTAGSGLHNDLRVVVGIAWEGGQFVDFDCSISAKAGQVGQVYD